MLNLLSSLRCCYFPMHFLGFLLEFLHFVQACASFCILLYFALACASYCILLRHVPHTVFDCILLRHVPLTAFYCILLRHVPLTAFYCILLRYVPVAGRSVPCRTCMREDSLRALSSMRLTVSARSICVQKEWPM